MATLSRVVRLSQGFLTSQPAGQLGSAGPHYTDCTKLARLTFSAVWAVPISLANAPFSAEGGAMEIVVDYLYSYTDATDAATWAADEVFFRERGFDLSYAFVPFATEEEATAFYSQSFPSHVLTYPIPEKGAVVITMRDYPDVFEEWEAQQYLYDNILKLRYEGPWVFQVTVE